MSPTISAPSARATRTIGFWMAVPMALLQAFNVLRVLVAPDAFAAYMGAPLPVGGDPSWVLIYASRTAFVALLATVLLVRRDLVALKWMAAAALVLPASDAWVAHRAGASAAIVGRHAAIAIYVMLTAAALWWATRDTSEA